MNVVCFFFNDTATTEIYTLSLHDALPICAGRAGGGRAGLRRRPIGAAHVLEEVRTGDAGLCSGGTSTTERRRGRSEEHTSELQSRQYLVCRLLLEKKKHTYVL